MKITNKIITYNDIVKSGYHIEDDYYGIAAYLTQTRINTFLHNPNLEDYEKCVQYLSLVDGVVVGRVMCFDTKLKIGDQIVSALSGSALEVYKDFRHLAVGVDLMMYPMLSKDNQFVIFSGISEMALPLYKKLKYIVFEFERMMLLKNAKCIVESKGVKGLTLVLLSGMINVLIRLFNMYTKWKSSSLLNNFEIRCETLVPDWVNDMILNDGHKYMEVHDRAWLQWNLDYNFKGHKFDKQSFYSIHRNGKVVGFFMTKERFKEEAGGMLKNVLIGSIVEWGTLDNDVLSEADINRIATTTFTNSVDIVEFATTDPKVVKKMRQSGYLSHGFAHIVFKDKTKELKDISDINLWRLRYGCADVILT